MANTNPYYELLLSEPRVAQKQIELMADLGFKATKRDGQWVLWELAKWPEVKIWLNYFQEDLSYQYILMLVYKAGMSSGKLFQANEIRLSLGMKCLVDEDVQRLESFRVPLMGIDHNPS